MSSNNWTVTIKTDAMFTDSIWGNSGAVHTWAEIRDQNGVLQETISFTKGEGSGATADAPGAFEGINAHSDRKPTSQITIEITQSQADAIIATRDSLSLLPPPYDVFPDGIGDYNCPGNRGYSGDGECKRFNACSGRLYIDRSCRYPEFHHAFSWQRYKRYLFNRREYYWLAYRWASRRSCYCNANNVPAYTEIHGFGNVSNLRQAMERDESGVLRGLVESFSAETDSAAFRQKTLTFTKFRCKKIICSRLKRLPCCLKSKVDIKYVLSVV